jgi:hypothetical protein
MEFNWAFKGLTNQEKSSHFMERKGLTLHSQAPANCP